ncbi:aquaporin-like protein [Obba rivulosa]|uniref:Aquaporin-like protein n=1 Tax=Obba rivulosa TaxID=1052685 RepID=A0A8E2ALH6_9APHY|nr:aquaporin-like protein [Obba rivulosa]
MSPLHQYPHREFVHLADHEQRPAILQRWERRRHREAHWLVECIAESVGVFLYVYAGVGSAMANVFGNTEQVAGLSSTLQIGLAYVVGIALALIIVSGTSGGHINPAVTLTLVILKKYPKWKAVRYIIAQILGSYIACLLIYVQWRQMIQEAEAVLAAKGTLDAVLFTPQGPAGAFALYVTPGTKLGFVFVNEFVVDFVIGLTIFACLDPTNFAVSPVAAPWVVGLVYGMVIWGYSPVGVATNLARDVGARFMAMTIWGTGASGGRYAAIAALTNIPATFLAACFYEFVFADSSRVITPTHLDIIVGHMAHEEHSGCAVTGRPRSSANSGSSMDGKGRVQTIEKV